eukprot:1148762-Heterocapsa_arctica.AAC.1
MKSFTGFYLFSVQQSVPNFNLAFSNPDVLVIAIHGVELGIDHWTKATALRKIQLSATAEGALRS